MELLEAGQLALFDSDDGQCCWQLCQRRLGAPQAVDLGVYDEQRCRFQLSVVEEGRIFHGPSPPASCGRSLRCWGLRRQVNNRSFGKYPIRLCQDSFRLCSGVVGTAVIVVEIRRFAKCYEYLSVIRVNNRRNYSITAPVALMCVNTYVTRAINFQQKFQFQ